MSAWTYIPLRRSRNNSQICKINNLAVGLMPIFSFYSRRGCWCFTHSWDLSAAGPVGSSTLYTKDVYPWQQGLHCSRAFYYWLLQWSQLQTIKCWGLTKWLPQWWHNGLIFHHALNCVSLCSQMLFNPLLKTERFTDFLLSPFCLCILLFPNQKKKKKRSSPEVFALAKLYWYTEISSFLLFFLFLT